MSFISRLNNFFRTTLIGGILVILPITIFVFLVKIIFDFMRRMVEPLSKLLDFGLISNQLLIDLSSHYLHCRILFFGGLIRKYPVWKIFSEFF